MYSVVLSLLSPLLPAHAAPPPSHVQAELVAETDSLRPGQPAWIAVVLTMEPGWHVYWHNPGDSGLSTTIRWDLPGSFDIGPIEWPAPSAFAGSEVTSYGYEGQVMLMSRVTPSADASTAKPAMLGATVKWLECREICLNGSTEVRLELPIDQAVPQLNAQWANAFAVARRRLPRVTQQWAFQARWQARQLLLQIQYADDLEPELSGAALFPLQPGLIEHNAPQRLTHDSDGYTLELSGAFVAPLKPVDRLQGVLVLQPAADPGEAPESIAVQVDVPIERIR